MRRKRKNAKRLLKKNEDDEDRPTEVLSQAEINQLLYAITAGVEPGEPELCRFYGLIVKMYVKSANLNPPHIHVLYNEYNGVIDIKTAEMTEGDLQPRALSLIKEWMATYKDKLLEIWETRNFIKLPPLE